MNKPTADVFAESICHVVSALALVVAIFELLQLPLRNLPLCSTTSTKLNPNFHLNKYNWIDPQ